MRRTWVAYVVRRKEGRDELLTLQVGREDRPERDGLPFGRIPYGRSLGRVIVGHLRLQTGLEGVRVTGDLGLRIIRGGQPWRGFLVEAPPGLPDEWRHEVPMRGDTQPVTIRWRDLAHPRPLLREQAEWLPELRRRLGLTDLEPVRLRAEPVSPVADGGWMRRQWTAAANLGAREPAPDGEALTVEIPADTAGRDLHRAALIQAATAIGYRVVDEGKGVAYPPGHSPAVDGLGIDPDMLDELWCDREFVAALARLAGPLQVWRLSPPIDREGVRNDWRDATDALPPALWASPENQRLILELDGTIRGYMYDNDGLLLAADAPTERLARLDETRVEHWKGASIVHARESCPEWPGALAQVGWSFEASGNDGDWGELRVAPVRRDLLEAVRAWCRENGRAWAERGEVDGEIRRIRRP